jgi:hypothetical protein
MLEVGQLFLVLSCSESIIEYKEIRYKTYKTMVWRL